jgi:hypothetical protein
MQLNTNLVWSLTIPAGLSCYKTIAEPQTSLIGGLPWNKILRKIDGKLLEHPAVYSADNVVNIFPVICALSLLAFATISDQSPSTH